MRVKVKCKNEKKNCPHLSYARPRVETARLGIANLDHNL